MRNSVALIVAIIAAAGVAYLVKGQISPPPAPKEPVVEMVRVVAAKVDIPSGTFIKPEVHLTWITKSKDQVSGNELVDGVHSLGSFTGAVSKTRIIAGEPITMNMVVKPDDGGFMSAVLSPGMRAVSVAVTPTSGNAGFIFPGDKVDLVLMRTVQSAGSPSATNFSETIVENVRVLAVDQRFNNDSNEIVLAKTITLEVSPKQAELVILGSEIGKLSLSLRSVSATSAETIPTEQVNFDTPSSPTTITTPAIEPQGGAETAPESSGGITMPYRVTVTKGSTTTEKEFIHQRPE